ncbi:MAG: hypothetical protein ACR2NN_06175 [Bryobacteraceae bacterium]
MKGIALSKLLWKNKPVESLFENVDPLGVVGFLKFFCQLRKVRLLYRREPFDQCSR